MMKILQLTMRKEPLSEPSNGVLHAAPFTYQIYIDDTLSVITSAFWCGKVKNSSWACTLHSIKHTQILHSHIFKVVAMRRYCRLNFMLFMRMNVLSINIFRIHTTPRNPKCVLQNQHIILAAHEVRIVGRMHALQCFSDEPCYHRRHRRTTPPELGLGSACSVHVHSPDRKLLVRTRLWEREKAQSQICTVSEIFINDSNRSSLSEGREMVTAECRPHYDILILDVVASHIPFHVLSASLAHFSGDYSVLCLHNSIVELSSVRVCVGAGLLSAP